MALTASVRAMVLLFSRFALCSAGHSHGSLEALQSGGTAQRQQSGAVAVRQQRHGQDSRQVGIEPEHPGSARLNGKAGEPVGGQDQQHQPQQLQVVVRQHRVNGIQPVGEDQPGQQQHRHRRNQSEADKCLWRQE